MKIILLLILISIYSLAQNRWEKLNGPVGGHISSLFTMTDTVIAGTGYDHALIFYSTDKGTTWKKANIKVPLSFTSFVTTDDGGVITAARSNGLYKSYDLKNWQNIYNNDNIFWDLGKDFENKIYAGTRNFNMNERIFISPADGLTTIKLYDILGREVYTLINEQKAAGIYQVELNASSLASGIYFYKLTSGQNNTVKKLQLIK